jgi:hypothetical protein
MSNHIFKLGFFGVLFLFGAVAIFMGGITGYAALSQGEITWTAGGASTTVSRAGDPSGFWRVLLVASALPFIGGCVAVWYGRRGIARL